MKTILFIEDQPTIRSMITDLFSAKGYHVETESNGKDGVEAALKKDFDVVMLDLKMPEMDGLEALEKIKAVKGQKQKVVIYSNVSYPFAEDEAFRKGADAFIHKDQVDPQSILTAIEQVLAK